MSRGDLRRVFHATTAAVVLSGVQSPAAFRLLTVYLAATAVIVETVRLRVPAFRAFLARAVPVFRDGEERRPSGAAWLMIGYAIAAQFPAPAGAAGVLAAGLADPAGAFVGTRLGRGSRKSVAGSATVAVVTAVVAAALGWSPPAAVAIGLAGAAAERWSGPIDDNLVMAPVVAGVATLLA